MLPAAAANVAPLKDSYLFPHSVHSAHYTKFMQKYGTAIKTFLTLISGLKTGAFHVIFLLEYFKFKTKIIEIRQNLWMTNVFNHWIYQNKNCVMNDVHLKQCGFASKHKARRDRGEGGPPVICSTHFVICSLDLMKPIQYCSSPIC